MLVRLGRLYSGKYRIYKTSQTFGGNWSGLGNRFSLGYLLDGRGVFAFRTSERFTTKRRFPKTCSQDHSKDNAVLKGILIGSDQAKTFIAMQKMGFTVTVKARK